MQDEVQIGPYLLRFGVAYVALSLIASLLVSALGVKSGAGVSIAILIACALYPANKFAADHVRPFAKGEFWRLLLGCVALDLVLQTGVTFAVAPKLATSGTFVGVLAFVGVLHGAAIAFVFSDRMMNRFVQGHQNKKGARR